jgi:hypothetical protein
MKKTEIIKQLLVTKEFTSNKAAKEILEKAIQFTKRHKEKPLPAK